jgi:hypothetical protein
MHQNDAQVSTEGICNLLGGARGGYNLEEAARRDARRPA